MFNLHKYLIEDREVKCWEQQLQGASQDILFVEKPCTLKSCDNTFQTLNANGLRLNEDGGSDLSEVLNQGIVNRSVNVLLIERTRENRGDLMDIGNLPATFFIHGATQDNNHIHGGVGIGLSRSAYRAWVESGKEKAVNPGIVFVTTTYMSMDLDWEDNRKSTMK